MPRLFTALDLPAPAIDVLRAFQQMRDLGVRARWTPPENLHLTLRFIGEVDEAKAARVEATLEAVNPVAPFEVVPVGLGVLPSRQKPRVLTLRIEPTEPLCTLYETLQDVLAGIDVEREQRTFRPHITLARMKNADPERLYASLRDTPDPALDAFTVDRFYLYESTLTPKGAVHTVRATYPLDATQQVRE